MHLVILTVIIIQYVYLLLSNLLPTDSSISLCVSESSNTTDTCSEPLYSDKATWLYVGYWSRA